ncbi:hypothetical protein B0T22DRAFT_414152, partial [Podospora appendiculata]
MRPDDAFGRPRAAADSSDSPSAFNLPAPIMSFVFAEESSIGSSPPAPLHRLKDNRKAAGVSEGADASRARGSSHHQQQQHQQQQAPVLEPVKHDEHTMSRPATPTYKPSSAAFEPSLPATPSLMGASRPASAMSSISSRRNSLSGMSDDMVSHAPSLDGETDKEPLSSMMDSGSAPQLIMPSIKMPSRRPFTEDGKSMGRLKVLIAGDSGVGKTSLIKAIVQSCEHIVHVDPITPSLSMSMSMTRPATRSRGSRRDSSRAESGTNQITEIFASTKPYPEWWSEIDDFRVLKRRKSLGDSVLDRNICFVDTPGYGSGSSSMATITPVARYIESQLQRMSSNTLADSDMLNLLGGEGGVQVDVVFYMVVNRLRPVDIAYLRELNPLTNIVFLLAHVDLMSAEQIVASKEQIHSQLKEANIWPFSFSTSSYSSTSPFSSDSAQYGGIYAISSATGSDHETMDASLLMSPDYVQPLITTDLATLVEQVFSSDGASWLRHAAAKKYIQWRKAGRVAQGSLLRQHVIANSTHHSHRSGASTHDSHVLTPAMGATSSYALARITDHTQREERLAQVRLTNWAADLQRSLANERKQYEALARSERAIWLTEKLNECVQDGTLVAVPGNSSSTERMREKIRQKLWADHRQDGDGLPSHEMGLMSKPRGGVPSSQQTQAQKHQDPLGLLEVAAELRYKGLIALEVLGGLGVLGGLALWVGNRVWGWTASGWVVGEWDKFW